MATTNADSSRSYDPLHYAVIDLAWQIRALPADCRAALRRPLRLIIREMNHLRRSRDRHRACAALLQRLLEIPDALSAPVAPLSRDQSDRALP